MLEATTILAALLELAVCGLVSSLITVFTLYHLWGFKGEADLIVLTILVKGI